ncbi:D-alanyl-D-alanine carboxypeptidase/D-alanyl-D-alanine-endopeptidase [Pseudonocardia sp. WMMC193]|uniref:D-alanyl-D-alanine carboxypeptidase/D-alanyl-D-alanine endopeptidase n=1 Tax=Pseudonocardia sp. WMMC193 TaxID=2911965 RepID=UPI001F02A03B|nr:D-alanyl-D-alanine carboxypeptidase/D-alanyl-D-alanine-endopeptidase [Pseudonocardia sp. WMMC193]MCF7552504.1 D-alanyl-D-alanine carboxypeptidase/D-alanyl-D-alanine-endopeptidase [Pseudonocardia sp. WMMC193]
MGFGRRIGDTLRLPTRKGRTVLIVLVVLALAAAAGGTAALHAPNLLVDLGIRDQAVPEKQLDVPVPELAALSAAAPTPSSSGLGSVLGPLAGSTALGDFSGIVVDPAAPRGAPPLWQQSPEKTLVPGSTGKLLTASAALLTLDPTDRLATRVVAGAEPGQVVLIGGGDPTLTALPAGRTGTYPDPARLDDLVALVKKAVGSQPITSVVIDTSLWTGPELAEGWDPADVAGGFVAPMVPLMLDGGRRVVTEQDTPRVADPATEAGRAFAQKLGVTRVTEGTAPPNAKELGRVVSAPISSLVEHLMTTSDNVLAESLARTVALSRQADPSFTGSADAVLGALTQSGFDVTGAHMVDGSGLSTEDRVPAPLLAALLQAAAAPTGPDDGPEFLRPIITGLPVAGGDGTLDDRFGTGNASVGRGVVRAKTGTLTGVSSLAGVVTDVDGRLLVFALMSNGESPADVRPRLDTIAATLSRCGCR